MAPPDWYPGGPFPLSTPLHDGKYNDTAETAYLTLTNVTNSNTTSSDQLEIRIGVTIFNSSELAMGELNWISVGAEFLNFSRIWVGQVGLFVDPYEMEIISSPVLDFNETITINKGESGVITLLMNIYEHSYTLQVNARIVAPVNSPAFHICKLGVRKTGDGYCLENSSPVFKPLHEDMVTGYNTDALFDFKEIIYGGQNGDMVSSLIVMDLHVYLPDVADVLPGETYAVHFDVYIDGTMHTVSDTFLAGGSVTPSESPLLPAFAITFPEIQDVFNYSPNELLQLNVAITFPVGVYRDISVEVSATGTVDPISLLSVETTQVGYNLGCFDTCQSFQPRNECPVATDVITMTQPVINHGLRCWKGDKIFHLKYIHENPYRHAGPSDYFRESDGRIDACHSRYI
ncbi:hypothetical protein BSL78_21468 [Apostichopus japonicus]|uniref:Uncharacterized protein n=1 Tax=Stichopus japonicus TaxID=307972 RepID=A0A2G8K110_STIJA|nr:hypothetical protein BSL78_21468 [Apostichopus japonicus]